MTKNALAEKIFHTAYLTGNFKLRSGQTSHEYFDKYRFEANPVLLREIAEHMKQLVPVGTQVLAGLEMGGIPVATALSFATGLPCAFIRKEAKSYGTCLLAEGADVRGKRVCIIEDVITTGGQVVLSTQDLRDIGAHVLDVLCVIHRGQTPEPKLANIGLNLRALFKMEELTVYKK